MNRLFRGVCCVVFGFGMAGAGTTNAEETKELPADSVRRGIEFLLENQNRDGSWGSHHSANPYQITCDVPGSHYAFRGAVTGLCTQALIEWAGPQDDAMWKAARKGVLYLVEHGHVPRANSFESYNIWTQAYSLRALARACRVSRWEEIHPVIEQGAKRQIVVMAKYQEIHGGWGYLNFKMPKPVWSTPFTTATTLISLYEARESGFVVPEEMIQKGAKLLERQRSPEGSYRYSLAHQYRPQGNINRTIGSLARNQSCNLALYRFGSREVGMKELEKGVEEFFRHKGYLKISRGRPIPHESWFQISGYFQLYGHCYVGMVIRELPPEKRSIYAQKLQEALMEEQRPDGSWWDYPLYNYHKQYGTGYALLALAAVQEN